MIKSNAIGGATRLQNRRWASYWLVAIGLWLTVMMFAVKVWAGWATQSLSLLTAALHTLVVAFSLLLSLLGMWVPSTRDRPLWGHSKLETGLLLTLIGGMSGACCSLLGVAFQQMQPVVTDWITTHNFLDHLIISLPVEVTLPLLHLLVGIAAAGVCIGAGGWLQAKLLESEPLLYSFRYSVLDAGLMMVGLGTLWGVYGGYDWLDPAITGMLVLAIALTVWQILNQQLPSLLRQVAIAPEAIAKTIRQVEGILHCYNIHSRGMVGRFIVVELSLILHPECLTLAPQIAQRIERLIRQKYGPARVVIHIEKNVAPKEA
jgi:divalent metal cation (Fe/Co/Zn/Cd) transporter